MLEDYEEFSEQQKKIIDQFVTNTSSRVFVLRNLPEVIKGALFSRYSRSRLGLRALLLKEFIENEDMAFNSIANASKEAAEEEQFVAIKKAQNFYDRILDGYGDDSIGELGGAHLAVEHISMLGAKVIEDARIGGSPLEKSTRYIYFDQKVNDQYLYYREPILMTSAYRDTYTQTCDMLFDTYRDLIPPLTELMEKKLPRGHEVSKVAYTAALRAKVLDCLRGLLPASSLTNMGLFGNGRFFENLLQRLGSQSLSEMQEISRLGYSELEKVIPSFVRRAKSGHRHNDSYVEFKEKMNGELSHLAEHYSSEIKGKEHPTLHLIHYEEDAPLRVASALLFPHTNKSFHQLNEQLKQLPSEDIQRILEASCAFRENRRHKSPRALENATFTFEICADFGIYRDLQRHRMLTQERQFLTCDYEYYVPHDIAGTEMEKKYREALNRAKEAFDTIRLEFPEEAQYVVPMAYNIRWYFHVNLRALQWLCELRSSPAGHPTYRYVAQEMAKQVIQVFPEFERFFRFVDFEGYEMGRLGQEIRTEEKAKARES